MGSLTSLLLLEDENGDCGESGALVEARAVMAFCNKTLSRSNAEIELRCDPRKMPAATSATAGKMNNLGFNS